MDSDASARGAATESAGTNGEAAAPNGAAPLPVVAPRTRVDLSMSSRNAARIAAVVLGVVGLFLLGLWLFRVTAHLLFLFVLAWLFAAAMEPGIRWFMRRGRSRGLAAAITGAAIVFGGLALIAVFGDLFVQQAIELFRTLPGNSATTLEWVNSTFHVGLNRDTIVQKLQAEGSQIANAVQSVSTGALGVLGSLASVVADLVTVMVFGFYMAAAGPKFIKAVAQGLPPRQQEVFATVATITIEKTGGFVASKITLALLSATFHGILFAILGVPYWLPFALLVGITAQFVPLIGTYIGVLLPVLAVLADGTAWKALAIIAFAGVYQQVESYVFTPRVSKKTMDVNPAIALAAVFIGGAIWGPIGLLIGTPLVGAAIAIVGTYRRRYDLVPSLADRLGD